MMTVCRQIFREVLSITQSLASTTLRTIISFALVAQPIFYQAAFSSALANPSNIIPDGSTNTTIDTSPNNITIVEIATPSANGTSMNNFDQFNVDQTGAILNNSSIVTNTQLGGWIYANPHISNGTQATIIVGEVTSTSLQQTSWVILKLQVVMLNLSS